MEFTDSKADGAAFVFGEELVFPEGGNTLDFESGAEALADAVDGKAGEPVGDSLEGGCGSDSRAVSDSVVGEATGGVADDDLLLEEDAEPFGGIFVGFGEGEGSGGDVAAVGGDREGDGAKVGRVGGTNVMDEGSTFAVDPTTVDGVESPSTVEGEVTGGRDAGFEDGNGFQGFDGVKTDVGECRSGKGSSHGESVSREKEIAVGEGINSKYEKSSSRTGSAAKLPWWVTW